MSVRTSPWLALGLAIPVLLSWPLLAQASGPAQAQAASAVAATAVVATPVVVTAGVEATTDVEATMKKMGFTFKQAMTASDVATMQTAVTELGQLVAAVQAYQFAPEKQAIFQQGLTEVQQQVQLAQQALTAQDLAGAKTALGKVDSLKKQYHKERSPSWWQLLFGN